MSNFTVRVEGVSALRVTLPKIPKEIERLTILRMSQIAFDSTQRGAGRHSKTGALFQSVYNRAIPGGREVGHDPQRAPHALFVNFGTKPHIIRPRPGGPSSNSSDFGPVRTGERKALRWVIGNRYVFAKFVRHPGYKGDPYILDAATDAMAQFKQIVDQATKDAAS